MRGERDGVQGEFVEDRTRQNRAEAVVPDVPPRFFLRLKSKSVDKEGVVIKIAAEFETEKAEWVRELAKAIAECPKDIDDDPVRAALEDKKRKVSVLTL